MMKCEPFGIYLAGSMSDLLYEEGKTDELLDKLKLIKEQGVKVGVATHDPQTLLVAERDGWDVDFYMTCVYNARRTQRGQQSGFITGKSKEFKFYPEDPPYMYEAIRSVKKPCIAFKIFAGGQVFYGKSPEEIPAAAEKAISEAYANIKQNDVICIAVYQQHKDQLKENIGIVNRVLA
jgi:hypothetical protein